MKPVILSDDSTREAVAVQKTRHWWRLAWAIVVLALALRVGALVVGGPFVPAGDEGEYIAMGHQVATKGTYNATNQRASIFQGGNVGDPTALRAPALPVFLAIHERIFGTSTLAPRLSLIALGALSCLLLAIIGRNIFAPNAGLWAALIWAVWPLATFSEYGNARIIPETLAIFLLLAAAALLSPLARRSSTSPDEALAPVSMATRWALGAGVLLGLTLLTRGYLIFVLPLWMLALWLRPVATAERRRLVVAFALGTCLTVLPWVVRNKIMLGKAVLATQTDAFYWGNNRWARGSFNGDIYALGRRAPQVQVLEQKYPNLWSMNEIERSEMWTREGMNALKADPKRAVWLIARKMALVFSPLTYAPLPWYRYHWLWLLTWPIALAGAVVAWRRGWRFATLLAASPFVCVTVAQLMTFSLDRYRYPAEPLMLLLACYALWHWLQQRRQKPATSLPANAV